MLTGTTEVVHHWAHNVVSTRDVTLNQRYFSVDQNLNSSGSRACYVKGRRIDQCQKQYTIINYEESML